MALRPLGAEAIDELLRALLGGDASLAPLVPRLRDRAGGNPFFAEELVQSLVDVGTLGGTKGAYRLETPIAALVSEPSLPPSVHAVLAARIDRLAEPEKRVLEAAAVIGREVFEPLLRRVCDATTELPALGDRFEAAWAARDWEGIAALYAPGFRLIDHRSYAHLDLDRDQALASLRFRFEMRSSRTTSEVLATRGDRLALWRERFELADGDVGPSETESLQVVECDERGDYCVALVAFDPDALDAAYAELDRRHAAGEAAAHGRAPESVQRLEPAPATKP